MIQEVNNNTLEVSYTYGHDLLSQNRDNVIVDYHYDGLGSARFLSDESGVFTDSYDYEAFGKLINKEGNTTNHYLYAGEQYDEETQNYYLRARYFSPTTGRFTQQDTYMGNNQDPITLHKYLYANANPTNMIDPSGKTSMMSLTASIAINSILVGARAYGIYSTASDIYNGRWDSIVEDTVLSMVGGKLIGGIYNKLSQYKLMQNMSKRFQSIIDKYKNKTCPIFNSFDGTTLVATQNGLVPISEIKIGDKVWAYNEANQTKSLQEVTHLIVGEGDKELVDITLSSGEVITATSNHPIWEINTQEWKNASELTNSSILYNINDKNVTIKSLTNYAKNKRVYNLTVANIHTYYVGLDGVLGHNSRCPKQKDIDILQKGGNNTEVNVKSYAEAEALLKATFPDYQKVSGIGHQDAKGIRKRNKIEEFKKGGKYHKDYPIDFKTGKVIGHENGKHGAYPHINIKRRDGIKVLINIIK